MRHLVLLLASVLPALTQADIGQIKNLSGDVRIERAGEQHAAAAGGGVEAADTIITGSDGRVGITLIDNSRLGLGPDSRLELARFRFDATTHEGEFVSRVRKGTLSVISGQIAKHSPNAMKVETPTSVLSVRGTRFVVKVE